MSNIQSSPLEISLDIPGYGRTYFQIGAPVRPSLVSVFPQKVVTGDYNRDTEQVASNHIVEDLTGGALVLREVPSEQFDRFWDSTLNTLYKLQLTLPFLPVDTGAPSDAATNSQARAGAVLNGNLYTAWDAKVSLYNNTTSTWNTSLKTFGVFPSAPSLTPSSSGGTLATGTYGYRVSAVGANGVETQAGTEATASVTGPTGSVALSWTGITTAASYNVYGRTAGSELKLTNVTGTSFTDTGSLTPSGALPLGFNATVTDAIYYSGKIYFSYHNGWSSYDGTTWSDNLFNCDFLTGWDSKLWFIASDGSNFQNFDAATSTYTAFRPLNTILPGDITGLTTYYDYFSAEDVFAITKTGPYLYDATARKWLRVPADLPRQQWGGKGFAKYRNTLFMSAGTAIYAYSGGSVSPMGLDRDWGLPSYLQGHISKMAASPAFLVALIDSTVSTGSPAGDFDTAIWPNFASTSFPNSSGYVSAWVWNDKGWHHLYRSSNAGTGASWLFMGDNYNDQRLWIGANGHAIYIKLPDGIVNPLQAPALPYAPSGFLILPWFDGGWSDLDKLAIRLRLKVSNITSTETIKISYAINESNQFVDLITINNNTPCAEHDVPLGSCPIPGNGFVQVYWNPPVPSSNPNQLHLVNGGPGYLNPGPGMVFKNIQFRVDMQRGTVTTKTPVLNYMTLKYQKVLDPLYGYAVNIVIEQAYRGRSVQQQIAALEQAISLKPMLQFRYRDLNGIDQVRWVKVSRAASSDYGGGDQRGRYDLSLIEE